VVAKWKKLFGLKPDKGVKEQLGLPVYKNRNAIIDHIMNLWQTIFTYPDIAKGWYVYAVKAGDKLLREESFDAILSSSFPATTHLIAKELKKKRNVPWIADLRDLWTQNNYHPYNTFRRCVERRLEIRTLSSADILTTISNPLVEKLSEIHRKNKIVCIPEGFDPEQLSKTAQLADKFTIMHAGSLYKGKRDPEPLFKATQELIIEKIIDPEKITIDFYGSDEGWLGNIIEKYGLQNIVKIKGAVPKEEVIKKERTSQLLLLLTWDNPDEKGVCPGKIFEYFATQRPIVSMGLSGGIVEELLRKTNAGIHVSSKDGSEGIKSIIKKAYCEFKLTGKVTYHGIQSEIDKYSHREMAKKFAALLDALIVGKKTLEETKMGRVDYNEK